MRKDFCSSAHWVNSVRGVKKKSLSIKVRPWSFSCWYWVKDDGSAQEMGAFLYFLAIVLRPSIVVGAFTYSTVKPSSLTDCAK